MLLKVFRFVHANGVYLNIYGAKDKFVVMASKKFSNCSFEIPYQKLDEKYAPEIEEKLMQLLKSVSEEDVPPWVDNKKKSTAHDIKVMERIRNA